MENPPFVDVFPEIPKEVAWLDAAGHLFPLIRVGILLQSRTVAR